MHVTVYRNLASLPDAYEGLFEQRAGLGILTSREWIDNFARNGLPAGDKLRIYATEDPEPVGLLVGVRSRLYSLHPRARVLSFQQPDGLVLEPLLAPGRATSTETFSAVIDKIRDDPRPYDVIRFGPMDPESPEFTHVVERLRARGFLVQTYLNFPNWHARVAGMTSEDFLRQRSRDFRRSIRRRARRLAERSDVRYELITSSDGVENAILDYQRIFAARLPHLQEEPTPAAYIPGTIRCAAHSGTLRLGIIYVADQPAAFQYCVISARTACFLRTGYDRRFRQMSVGKSVIFNVLAHVLDEDRVDFLDFGVGDHEYKSDWVQDRRQRFGIAAYNPRTYYGLKNAALHIVGSKAKPVLKGMRDRVLRWLP